MLIGQDWLEKFGYDFQIPSLGITLPAYSETIVRIPTQEKGTRLTEAQELQENIFCASSVVDCKDNSFLGLIINLNSTEQKLKHVPLTQELPKLSGQYKGTERQKLNKRSQTLQAQLRLSHIKEEEEQIRQICTEFIDVFKLPGTN